MVCAGDVEGAVFIALISKIRRVHLPWWMEYERTVVTVRLLLSEFHKVSTDNILNR